MHLCLDKWVALGRVVVYFAKADHALSAGIKCRHCTYAQAFTISLIVRSTVTGEVINKQDEESATVLENLIED